MPKRTQRKLTKKDIGDNLERLVEELFRKKGYKTEKNVYLEGKSRTKHEIDVLAVIKGPLHEDKILIECKAHNQPIGKDAVMKLKHIVEDVGANVGIVISVSGFTSGAIQFANEVNIDLMDGHELEKELKSSDIKSDERVQEESFSEHLINEYPKITLVPEFITGMNPFENVYLGLYGYEIRNLLNETIEDARLHVTLMDDKKNKLRNGRFFLSFYKFIHEDEKQNEYEVKVVVKSFQKIGTIYPDHKFNQSLPVYPSIIDFSMTGYHPPGFIFDLPVSVFNSYLHKLHLKIVLKSGRRTIEERFIKPKINSKKVLEARENAITKLQEVNEKSSRCFIATAVYGTPHAAELIVLRNFRDEVLLTNSIGQRFTRAYYKTSPPIAKIISKSILLRKIVGHFFVFPATKIIKHFRTNY
ncbi:restriction endonuclease [archaeon BMS3Abin16]|nr:restriction endonuclease [archaeon BMS3Abin16]